MRQIKVSCETTYIIANTLISSKKGITSPDQWGVCVSKLPEKSTIISCGNLFGSKCTQLDMLTTTVACSKREIDLWCIEGNSDYQVLWKLARERRIKIGGDMLLLHDKHTKVCLSFYPLLSWPQQDKGAFNLHGKNVTDCGTSPFRQPVLERLPRLPLAQLYPPISP